MEHDQPIVKVNKICKGYGHEKNRVEALIDLSFEVRPADFLALCGPSGSGKTTALNLIGALDKPDKGEIAIGGKKLSGMNSHDLTLLRRNTIGFIFQSFNLIPVMTVVENAEFVLGLMNIPKVERRQRALQYLDKVGLNGLHNRFPHQLSGGQQQRVAIARAIAPKPQIVLADEPTANLDSKNAIALIDLMEDLNREQGVTFIFSTHDSRIVERAKRVIVLCDGRVVEDKRADKHP